MAHLVAGYPTIETSYEVAQGLIEGGADYLELQFPFSDPTADGPTIEKACKISLENGFKVSKGFSLIKKLSKKFKGVPLFLMCYGNTAFAYGLENFLKKAKECGASGVIIPDLPPDYDEGLFNLAKTIELDAVPVIAPSISNERIELIKKLKTKFIYTAIRSGITGSKSSIDNNVTEFLQKTKKNFPEANILAGFGIRSRKQIKEIRGICDTAVVGSYFVEAVTKATSECQSVREVVKEETFKLIKG